VEGVLFLNILERSQSFPFCTAYTMAGGGGELLRSDISCVRFPCRFTAVLVQADQLVHRLLKEEEFRQRKISEYGWWRSNWTRREGVVNWSWMVALVGTGSKSHQKTIPKAGHQE
jgi:hypothetical protein